METRGSASKAWRRRRRTAATRAGGLERGVRRRDAVHGPSQPSNRTGNGTERKRLRKGPPLDGRAQAWPRRVSCIAPHACPRSIPSAFAHEGWFHARSQRSRATCVFGAPPSWTVSLGCDVHNRRGVVEARGVCGVHLDVEGRRWRRASWPT